MNRFVSRRILPSLFSLTFGYPLGATVAAADSSTTSIAGVYSMREVVAMKQHVLPSPFPALSMKVTSYGFVNIEETANGLVATETFCDIAITPRFPVGVTIPQALTRVIKVQGPLVESVVNGQTIYVREEAPTVVGAHLEDPINDPLPSDPSDPRIFDEDGDGKLGITTQFSGFLSGETYSVRRERYSFELTSTQSGRLEGLMRDRSEEQIVEATKDVLKRKVEITPDPDAKKTFIQLVPFLGESNCEALLKDKALTFPPLSL